MRRIKRFFERHKVKLIAGLATFIILSVSLQLYLFYKETLYEEDIVFADLSWSEFCDGTAYNEEDRITFCQECEEQGGKACEWPLDMTILIDRVPDIIRTGGEVHCYLVINDINYYHDRGKYYGVINETLFTWEVLDATKKYNVEVCCGIERQTGVVAIFRVTKKWPQACVYKEALPRCYIE